MERREYVKQHYENYNEEGRFEARWCRVEYLTTLRYIHKYLKPGDRVLEIGAGTGRYSIALAAEGYHVTAVELVPRNLECLREKIAPQMRIRAMEGDALDLSALENEVYDVTLLLGPMYHLYCEGDKLQALSEAIRVTKRGGIVMVAYCITDGPMVNYTFRENRYKRLLESGVLDKDGFFFHPEQGGFQFEHIRKADVDRLMAHFDTERLHYVATDGLIAFLLDEMEQMDEETYEAALRYHFSVCEQETLVDATAHSLDIFRKN